MVLAFALGYALQRFAGMRDAAVFGLLLGMLVAPLVPSRAACRLPPRRPDEPHEQHR